MEKPKLNHIALKVKDLEESKEFYRDILGLEVQEERLGKSVMLKDNYGGIIGLILSNENIINGIDHFGFTFRNLENFNNFRDKIKDKLSRKKMPYEEKEHHDGSMSLFFNDINGYKIQLVYLPLNYFRK